MKKLALTIVGVAPVALGLLWFAQSRRIGTSISNDPTVEHSRAFAWHAPESAPVSTADKFPDGQKQEEKVALMVTAQKPAPDGAEPLTGSVRQLLQDVATGRLLLESDEAEVDTLDLAQPDAVPSVVRLWARKDCAAATRWTAALPESDVKSASLRQIAVVMAESDPAAAIEWANGLVAGPSREAAMESLAAELSSANPKGAMMLAEEMSAGVSRDQRLIHALSQWAAQDPAEAAAHARELADATLRSNALVAVATAWAERDPVSAGTLAAQEITDPALQARAVISIVQRWAQTDPAAAAAWIKSFNSGVISSNAVEQLVVQWVHRESDAPRRWLGTLPNAATRDAGFASLARALAISQPAQALQCAALISDPARRNAVIQQVRR